MIRISPVRVNQNKNTSFGSVASSTKKLMKEIQMPTTLIKKADEVPTDLLNIFDDTKFFGFVRVIKASIFDVVSMNRLHKDIKTKGDLNEVVAIGQKSYQTLNKMKTTNPEQYTKIMNEIKHPSSPYSSGYDGLNHMYDTYID